MSFRWQLTHASGLVPPPRAGPPQAPLVSARMRVPSGRLARNSRMRSWASSEMAVQRTVVLAERVVLGAFPMWIPSALAALLI